MQRTVMIQVEVAIDADTDEKARLKARALARIAHEAMKDVYDDDGRLMVKATYYAGHILRRY